VRQRQTTEAFRLQYAARAGIEGTHEQTIRRCGYIGQAKTHLQHIITATAINVVRGAAWLEGTPRAKTRRSAFTALAA
jgi:transposase